jgi:hypothetical protein
MFIGIWWVGGWKLSGLQRQVPPKKGGRGVSLINTYSIIKQHNAKV